ncbi:MAG: DUF4249 family protein [Saprospiraceae bacterium]|nr:DUF4249 family protein [Saprospiraceae bacterium]MBX7179066.1 DUF4249 domain-containing protein [Saprospiraceae bacterium]MCB0590405.1 DUF4249 family protein [Saprospiraceae bacterium]MCO5284589.1 DUF4249 domain-containing protein [Saprospiraceae bacterium]MCO6471419.1 DUF4249 family protein [Saprospiraceae bacterium]
MRQIVNYSLFCVFSISVLFFSSCNNELELIGDKVEIPVVYGTISTTGDFVFIRLERAFGDNKISPGILSKNPDSLYYKDAKVTISLPEENFSIDLEKTDAESLGIKRDTGVFANTPNYIYVAPNDQFVFKPGAEYQLTIEVKGKTYTAKTTLVNTIEIILPTHTSQVAWIPRTPELQSQYPRVLYEPKGENRSADPAILDLHIRFNYSEKDSRKGNTYEKKSFLIPVTGSIITDANTDFRYSPNRIFEYLRDHMEKDPAFDRFFTSFDFVITGGGREFLNFTEALAANAGITGTQDFPLYSNIEGGQGIFSSKNTMEFKGYNISSASLDSLAFSRYTIGLNFRKI